jgi:hypothetical protein
MSPGSVWIGSIQSNSFTPVLQRGHAGVPCLFSNPDTNALHCHMIRTPDAVTGCVDLHSLSDFCAMELEFNRRRFGRFPMPIRAYLDGRKFDGETIRQMGVAFEMALAALGFTPGCDDPIRKTLAESIIELAQHGERDPDRLCGACKPSVLLSSRIVRPSSRRDSRRSLHAMHSMSWKSV